MFLLYFKLHFRSAIIINRLLCFLLITNDRYTQQKSLKFRLKPLLGRRVTYCVAWTLLSFANKDIFTLLLKKSDCCELHFRWAIIINRLLFLAWKDEENNSFEKANPNLQSKHGVLGTEHHVKKFLVVYGISFPFVNFLDHLLTLQVCFRLTDFLEHVF